ncbi:TIGR03619 family F420-dependent LLM class oxidoreductase [Baekduia soli]|uniref:TIGR03619 family F420-dependent LLM class oxidoreductase n=1 Tax=Baekduia soli TaxID=496014 RepID=A0A5B8TZI4_9ACTN|nr:TIGR03619 family F420-dependent LLM class oxidoreductase [Baekduia soli]QEC46129.1 TIGR03619 family F420-dependent LLM class oxidoreductase [Baekduia soli]
MPPAAFHVRPPGWLGPRAGGAFAALRTWAQEAERLGFDGIFVGDRMLASARDADGREVYAASMLEPFTTLAALAACTTTVRLGTLVIVVPFRHPVPLAKAVASLDVLSEGRVILGTGVGWNGPEFAVLGLDPAERGPRFEEALEVMRALWTAEPVTRSGRFWELDGTHVSPAPAQDGGPPIWIAAFSPGQALDRAGAPSAAALRVLDRAGRLADGWVPLVYSASARHRLGAEALGRAWEHVLAGAERHGRRREDIDLVFSDWGYVLTDGASRRRCEQALAGFFAGDWADALRTYSIGTAEEVVERIRRDTASVDHVDAYVFTPLDPDPEQLGLLAEHVAPALRAG